MYEIQTISSDEDDDGIPDRPYATPGWFQPNISHDVDNALVQNNGCTAFNDNRKRVRLSDEQDSLSASRKRPHISELELEPFPNVHHSDRNRIVGDTDMGFSVISHADPEGPCRVNQQRDSFPEPARHSPFHFLKNNSICRSPEQGPDPSAEFDVISPVFNARRKPSQLSELVEVLSSDDSEDSFIWTSSQMVAPLRNFREQMTSDTADVVVSDDDDDDEIPPSQISPGIAKKDSNRFSDSFSERTVTVQDCDSNGCSDMSSVVREFLSGTWSETPISKEVLKVHSIYSDISNPQKSALSDCQRIVEPMTAIHRINDSVAAQSNIITSPPVQQRGAHSLFKIPVIVADCDNKLHTSCQGYNVNIAPLSSLTSQVAGSRTECVRVESPRPLSDVMFECKVVLKDVIDCGEVKSSCSIRNLKDVRCPASDCITGVICRDENSMINPGLPDVVAGNQPRNWSVSWDQSNCESQSVFKVTDQDLGQMTGIPVAQPSTGEQPTARNQQHLYVNVQRLSNQVDTSGGDVISDDDLFDDYTMTQCDVAIAEALQKNNVNEFKKPFNITVVDDATKIPQNLVNTATEGLCDVAVVAELNLYSQRDDCIILSDSDDEIFANLTQAAMNPMTEHDSDAETVDDGWNDDDDDIDATLLQLDESCFVVPQDDIDTRIVSGVECREEMNCDMRSEFCQRMELEQMSLPVKVESAKSYWEVEPLPDEAQYQEISVVKEKGVCMKMDCDSSLISPAQEETVPNTGHARARQFAFKSNRETAEECIRLRTVAEAIAEQSSDPDDDVPVGELLEKQKWKRFTEVKPLSGWMQTVSMEKKLAFNADDTESDEDETVLPRFDMSRSCLMLPKDVKIRSPQQILEVEIDEDPLPVRAQMPYYDPRESRDVKPAKQAETHDCDTSHGMKSTDLTRRCNPPKSHDAQLATLSDVIAEMKSDAEDDENYQIYLKDDETKVTKIKYLKCDELEKSKLVLQYYNFTEEDQTDGNQIEGNQTEGNQWLSKTSPSKPKVHSGVVASPRKKRSVVPNMKKTRLKVAPEKRVKRSVSEDQGNKIAQLRESSTLLKKKVLRPSVDNRDVDQGSRMDESIRNAKNVMMERRKQVERETAGRETCSRETVPGKVSIRRKTAPATPSSAEKVNVGSSVRSSKSSEKQGSAKEVSTSRANVSVLDAILGPADKISVPTGIRKSDAKQRQIVVTAHDQASRKHSKNVVRLSEQSGCELLKSPSGRLAPSREINKGFRIPRLPKKKADAISGGTLALNPTIPVSFSIEVLKRTNGSSLVTLEPNRNDADVLRPTEVALAREKGASAETNTETASNLSKRNILSKENRTATSSSRSNSSKRKLHGIVSESKSDLVKVDKSLAIALNSTKVPSKQSLSRPATRITESSISNSSTRVPIASSTMAPLETLSSKSSSIPGTNKSLMHATSSVSSMPLLSDLLSNPQKALDISCTSPSICKKDELHKIKYASGAKSDKPDSIRADREKSASKHDRKCSETSSNRWKRTEELDKRGSNSKSKDATAPRKTRSENSRISESTSDQQATVSADKSSSLGDNSVAAQSHNENCVVPNVQSVSTVDLAGQTSAVQPGWLSSSDKLCVTQQPDRTKTATDKQSIIGADATAADMADQATEVHLGQQLSDCEKQIMRPPDMTTASTESQSKTRHNLQDDKQVSRKKSTENQLHMALPVNEIVENQLETTTKSSGIFSGNAAWSGQTVDGAVPSRAEKPCRIDFIEPAVPIAVVRPLKEQNVKRGTREVVRTTAPALGREMESVTLSQIVNDSIRKTGPMPSPLLFAGVAPKKQKISDTSPSNRPLERECRKLTDLPKAKVNSTVLKDSFTSAILLWNPVWMQECEKVKAPPPIVNYEKVYPLLDTYDSFDDYANIVQPLMLLEMWESMMQDWKKNQQSSNGRSNKVMPTYLRIEKEQMHMFLHCQGVVMQNAVGQCLRESDLVILNLRTLPISPKGQMADPKLAVIKPVFGIVSKVTRHSPDRMQEPLHQKIEERKKSIKDRYFIITYIIEFAYRKQPIDNSDFISIELVTSILSTLRQFYGLVNLPRSTLATEILRPSQWDVFHHNMELGVNQLQDRYNPSQRDAISRIAKAVLDPYFPPKICLLQGPPGTGKSHTIIGLVEHLLAQNGNIHILLCAPSNAGIDELCRRLIAHNTSGGIRRMISFVRVGAKSSIHLDIAPYALQNLAKKKYEQQQRSAPTSVQSTLANLEQKQKEWKIKLEMCLKENKRYEIEIAEKELKMLEKRRESISGGLSKAMSGAEEVRMKKEVLMGVDIVCTTLNHSGSQHIVDLMYHQDSTKHHFGCVIVDEACQCTEVDCLIPLQYRSSKLVLVGDPEQLPPTVLSKKAGEMSYGQSLFERLYNQLKPAPSSNESNAVLMLQTQYRMHEEICRFSSKHFYYDLLKTDPTTAMKRSKFRSSPFSVFDLQYTCEKYDQRSVSTNNLEEAKFIIDLCQHLASWMRAEKAVQNIGIITPYQSQRLIIIDLLKQWYRGELKAIEVGTVDGFQGREKDVIIVSCVRANSSRNIGFLADRRRMNVSLTRAKYALYIVGHMKTLTSNSDWSALVMDAQHRGRLFKVLSAKESAAHIQHGCNKA